MFTLSERHTIIFVGNAQGILVEHPAKGQPSSRRQLRCVVFADMAGYSALTAKDELGTHDMWMTFVQEVVTPTSKDLEGEIVRTLGDGILLTFHSSTAAFTWAVNVQNRILDGRSGNARHYPGLSLRIAVHISEVISDGNDV